MSEATSSSPESRELQHGGCHCGRVRFATRGDFSTAISCNCSICQKRGHWLAFVPATDFELEAGGETVADYQFNHMRIHHFFCRNCGVGAFARAAGPDGTEMVAVNIRCLDDIDLTTVRVTPYDGRSH